MRAFVRLSLPDGRSAALGHGDLVGRLRSAALFVDDARVSEGHAMVSLRGGSLWLLALRGRLMVDGERRSELELVEGASVLVAPNLALRVEELVMPRSVLALEGEGLPRQILPAVVSLMTWPQPHLISRYKGDAAAWVWSDGEAWRVQLAGEEPKALEADAPFTVGGLRFVAVSIDLEQAGGVRTRAGQTLAAGLRIEARFDQLRVLREAQPPVLIGGIAARILCELVAMGGQAHWSVVAAEVWPGVQERHALRRKWDVALMRLRQKLTGIGLRADLVQGDGCGQIGLMLQPGDEMVDLG